MPITNFDKDVQLSAALSDTIVDVIPCWGTLWIICTTKIYRYTYEEGETGSYTLAYNFASAALGAEKIQCAIGFNGFMYIGTTQPDHTANARILRLVPPTDDIDDIDGDTNLLTATAELTESTADDDEHSFMGFAIVNQKLCAYYQYYWSATPEWLYKIYKQTAHATWSSAFTQPAGINNDIEIDASTHYSARRNILLGGRSSGLFAATDGAVRYTKIDVDIGGAGGSNTLSAGTSGYAHICKDTGDGFLVFKNSTLAAVDPSRGIQDFGLSGAVRFVDTTGLWYQGYVPTSPAFISSFAFHGGCPLGDTLFIGAYLTEDDGGGGLTAYDCILAREADGNWYMLSKVLNSSGVLTDPKVPAPRYAVFLDGAWRLIAPHAYENNFSILTPEFGGTVWTARLGI